MKKSHNKVKKLTKKTIAKKRIHRTANKHKTSGYKSLSAHTKREIANRERREELANVEIRKLNQAARKNIDEDLGI